MKLEKKQLIAIGHKVVNNQPLQPIEILTLSAFETEAKESPLLTTLKNLAVPASLAFGFVMAVFATQFEVWISYLPSWTNLPEPMLNGMNYLWNILSEPIEQPNIVYHLPNLILYSFGIVGLKSILDRLERQSWLDKVLDARAQLLAQIQSGILNLQQRKGHSILFIGSGDFIAQQFVFNHNADEATTISSVQPSYTKIWNCYDINSVYEDLKTVITRASGANVGEYFFFPVKDDQIFLPGPKDYDLSPHKLDILCQNLRTIEVEQNWKTRPIMIVGDRFHSSFVQSEDQKSVIARSQDEISLTSIAKKYESVLVFDPTDIVLKHILKIAKGRRIVFRATKDGLKEYKARFYKRLKLLGYKPTKKTILTIGYDLFEDQTEQQTLARKVNGYYPVVLSKSVRDALVRNGYEPEEFLYVPDLVLDTIDQAAREQ